MNPKDSLKHLIRCSNEEALSGSLSLLPGNDLELDFEVDGMIDFVARETGADVKQMERSGFLKHVFGFCFFNLFFLEVYLSSLAAVGNKCFCCDLYII